MTLRSLLGTALLLTGILLVACEDAAPLTEEAHIEAARGRCTAIVDEAQRFVPRPRSPEDQKKHATAREKAISACVVADISNRPDKK